ncbi:hypothetical protein K470DRAFT_254736 [Piedraia hortae CBS 480.64]|uniref:Uncharacterized protein n=1 Tax=Piedraia hortae CBS 480.64 TaxID=1314780 RepID=A0A6A7C8F8_9PEZI|nr:hypothetical protein K470DRAFT_254736 [Piedraia hortae CBS 480.64]
MSWGNVHTPDLQTILANLARLSGSQPPQQPVPSSLPWPAPAHDQGSSDVSRFVNSNTIQQQQIPSPAEGPVIAPAQITTWQAGYRCVHKIARDDGQFAAKIRKLMAHQRKTEMRWFSERRDLKQRLAARVDSSAQVTSILQSLGSSGHQSETTAQTDGGKALEEYDRGLYAAQAAMDEYLASELKAMGVPFFKTNPALVKPDGEDLQDASSNTRPKWSPFIHQSELLRLQRRMVDHLEDLYRD